VAISGAMAGSMRFVFQQGGPLAVRRRQSDGRSYRVPAAPLSATLRDPRFLIFFAAWVGLNALFGLGTLPIVGEGQEIAWQAHIGGFVAGLLLFNAFDPAMPRSEFDAGLNG
jgi:membrane associated rhomboid family serine protease